MSESLRRASSRDRVLELFQARGIVTNVELNQVCYRYGGRIHELRKLGYVIETGEKHQGIVSYSFHGQRAVTQRMLWEPSAAAGVTDTSVERGRRV